MLKELCGNRRSDSAIRSTARLTWRAYLAAVVSMRLVLYWILVPASGVEPPRPCGHEILSLARMPISPRRGLAFDNLSGVAPLFQVPRLRP